ncbi:MAG: amidohydrolase [Bacteroidales bacterium]|nr:amidohydrolase [Bacteroidales bacterium]
MPNLKNRIKRLAGGYLKEVTFIRRHLHAYPELSSQEILTAAFISKRLSDWGIEHQTGIAGHGIVGLIRGSKPGNKVIALRADMDALPIRENNKVPYVSANPGVMHACGHDVHMASLLGTAWILKSLESEISGTVKLIFQPSEEKYPGGALPMIKAGVLENPRPDFIIGQHVYPELEAGKIGLRSGNYMASTDEVHLTVIGKGGHAAIPNKVIDPVVITAHIILALQQIVSRNAQPTTPSVLSFGRIIADGQANIIPDEVKVSGTMRTFDEEWRMTMQEKISTISTSIAQGMGGRCEVSVIKGYPFVYNDPGVTEKVKGYAEDYLGKENVEELDMRMTAEDFSYFAQEIPGCFYRLGVMNQARGITSNLHTSTFDVDESSLETGMGLMSWIVAKELL